MIIITGCSAVGKTTLAKMLLEKYAELRLVISTTTRAPRPDDMNYQYVSEEEFNTLIKDDMLVDFNRVFSNTLYGTQKLAVKIITVANKVPLVVTDIHGAKNFSSKYPNALVINLVPRDRANVEWRIRTFRTDHVEERIANLDHEIVDDGTFENTFKLQELEECVEEIYKLVENHISLE